MPKNNIPKINIKLYFIIVKKKVFFSKNTLINANNKPIVIIK